MLTYQTMNTASHHGERTIEKDIFPHFFKLQKGNSTIYLLGTNHMLFLEDIPKWALAIIKDQLEKSERVFVEAAPPKKTLQQLKSEGFFEQDGFHKQSLSITDPLVSCEEILSRAAHSPRKK
ncbi:MAG: hypothetical protein KBD23_02480 [Gammaproteobacteria bacterium]|nr:hypothetical protein [Gammaproteobacteria bacterium]